MVKLCAAITASTCKREVARHFLREEQVARNCTECMAFQSKTSAHPSVVYVFVLFVPTKSMANWVSLMFVARVRVISARDFV